MYISFSPQNYTVPEGTPADIMIVLDKPSPKDITITVTTMDITTQGTLMQSDYQLMIQQNCSIIIQVHEYTSEHQTLRVFLFYLDLDYIGGSFNVVIPAGTVNVTLPVTTLTDIYIEDDKYFKATLNLSGAPETVDVGSSDVAFVTITDATRMCKVLL